MQELVGSKIGPKWVPVAVSDLFFVVGSGQGHWTGQGFNRFIVPARTPSDHGTSRVGHVAVSQPQLALDVLWPHPYFSSVRTSPSDSQEKHISGNIQGCIFVVILEGTVNIHD